MIRTVTIDQAKNRQATLRREPGGAAEAVRDETRAAGWALDQRGPDARPAAGTALASLRLRVLRELDRFGPRPIREMRRAWPITRQHLRVVVRSLAEDGLVAYGPNGSGPRSVMLTESGRRALEVVDWDEAVLSADSGR